MLPWGWGFGELAIAIIVIAAVVGIVYVALKQFGVTIPQWFVHVIWIVVCAFVCILAIRILMAM